MEHLLQKSKCSIFHNIFKYMIFQRCQNAWLWSKGLMDTLTDSLDPVLQKIKMILEMNNLLPT